MAAPVSNQIPYSLFLSEEGDIVEITSFYNGDPSHPDEAEAAACKTHEQVLAFLNKLKTLESKSNIEFYHFDNTHYAGHKKVNRNGMTHPCDLDRMIRFVTYKILEKEHGVRDGLKIKHF